MAKHHFKNRPDPLMIRFKYSDTEFYSEYKRARTIVDWSRVKQTTINSKMSESCSNYPPPHSKVLQSGSDIPALYSEKYPKNKFNVVTDALTVTSDTLSIETHSEDSASRSENPGSHSEHSEVVQSTPEVIQRTPSQEITGINCNFEKLPGGIL